MGDMRNAYKTLVSKSEGRGHLKDPSIYWMIILE
jgi:hypothetical protein